MQIGHVILRWQYQQTDMPTIPESSRLKLDMLSQNHLDRQYPFPLRLSKISEISSDIIDQNGVLKSLLHKRLVDYADEY